VNGPYRTFRLVSAFAWLRTRRYLERNEGASLAIVIGAMFALAVGALVFNVARMMLLIAAADVDLAGVMPDSNTAVLAFFCVVGAAIALFVAIGRANDVLFGRSDLDWALILPLDARGVGLARTAEVAVAAIASLVLVIMPACFALADVTGPWYVAVAGPLMLPAVAAVIASLAILFSAVIGRLAATSRARELGGLVGSLVGAGVWWLMVSRSGGTAIALEPFANDLMGALSSRWTAAFELLALPLLWPALVLGYLAEGRVPLALALSVAGAVSSAGVTWWLSAAGGRAYLRALARSSGGGRRAARRVAGEERGRAVLPARFRVLGALVRRDLAILTRSPRLWQILTMPIVQLSFVLIGRQRLANVLSGDWLLSAGIVSLFAAVVPSTLGLMYLGVEGRAFYHVSALPVGPHARVVSKTAVLALPGAAIGIVASLLLAGGQGTTADALRMPLMAVTASVTMAAVSIMASVGDTNFEAEHLKQLQSPATGCATGILMAMGALVCYLVLRAARDLGARVGLMPGVGDTVGVILLAAVLLLAVVPGCLRSAAKSLDARSRGAPPVAWFTWEG
jgi:hypothetical protein